LARHTSCDAAGNPRIPGDTTVRPGDGPTSDLMDACLMNARTERLPVFADAMTWFADDDTTTGTTIADTDP
jgi:hypothetical protein